MAATKTLERDETELAQTTALARLLLASKLGPLTDDKRDERLAERKSLWAADKQVYMAQARRLRRLLETNPEIELTFKQA